MRKWVLAVAKYVGANLLWDFLKSSLVASVFFGVWALLVTAFGAVLAYLQDKSPLWIFLTGLVSLIGALLFATLLAKFVASRRETGLSSDGVAAFTQSSVQTGPRLADSAAPAELPPTLPSRDGLRVLLQEELRQGEMLRQRAVYGGIQTAALGMTPTSEEDVMMWEDRVESLLLVNDHSWKAARFKSDEPDPLGALRLGFWNPLHDRLVYRLRQLEKIVQELPE